jgi:two-component system, NtrC family, sensor histidine kinase HydH
MEASHPRSDSRVVTASARPPSRPFNLTRRFSLLALACIASLSLAMALLLSNFLTDKMLRREATVSMEFVQDEVYAEHAAPFFLAPANSANVEETFQHFAKMPDVLRANVYARDRSVIWSSDKSLVGKPIGENRELDEALAGELAVESGVATKEEHMRGEHPVGASRTRYFVEIYVPVWDDAHTQIVGVVEIYKTPDSLFDAIHEGEGLIWLTSIAGGLLLYSALFWIVRRADRIMLDQQARLVGAERLAAVGEMASAVAHAIRNPLAGIRSSAELALDGGAQTFREPAEDIIAEVDRVEDWVRELLMYARPINGPLEPVDLNTVVQRSVATYAREIGKRQIAVKTALASDLPSVRGDASLLGQALNSLIANSLDAMKDGGRLTLISAARNHRREIELQLSDSGSGMGPDELSRIFRPFYTSKAKGLGLGLPLAKRIIERCAGRLSIQSKPGAGTTIAIRFNVSD